MPFHLDRNNVLAVGAQYQVFGTYVGAFIVISDVVNYSDTALGVGLVLVNVVVVPTIMYTCHVAIQKQGKTKRKLAKLHTQLLADAAGDEKLYQDAWGKLKADDEPAAERVLRGANTLAITYNDPLEARQLKQFEDVDELHAGWFARAHLPAP